jgi:molybdopterin biosynthesis enzyme MoaB
MPELVEDEIKRYVETDGSNCLFCAGDKLHLGKLRGGTGVTFRDITCLGCGETWREIFHLAEIQYPARADFAEVERP